MGKGAAANEVPSGELLPFASCCCAIYSCYNKFPDCCGIYSNTTCCCLQQELTCCKCDKELMDEDECCTMYQGKMACLGKPGCCKGVSQVCCIDGGGALPCDKDVPCMFGVCFVTCYPKCAVCKKVNEIVPPGAAESGGGAPPAAAESGLEAQTMDHHRA